MHDHSHLKKKITEEFNSVDTPDALLPENIDFKALKKKKPSAKVVVMRIAAAAAAVAIGIFGTFAILGDNNRSIPESSFEDAESYKQIYAQLKKNRRDNFYWGVYEKYYASSNEAGGAPEADTATETDYSGTNVQVAGVDEADVVKTDGRYIYILADNRLVVFDPKTGKTAGKYDMDNRSARNIYILDGRVAVVYTKTVEDESAPSDAGGLIIGRGWYPRRSDTGLLVLDVSRPGKISVVSDKLQSGHYCASRLIDGVIYLVSEYGVIYLTDYEKDYEDYIPYISEGGERACLSAEDISISDFDENGEFIVMASYDASGDVLDSRSVLGNGFAVYCAADTLFIYNSYYARTGGSYDFSMLYTAISSFALSNGGITPRASASLIGDTNNQFSFHYENGVLFVCTTYTQDCSQLSAEQRAQFPDRDRVSANGLFALDGNLKIISSVKGLGLNESIRSARYVNGICYFVTYEQTDPLFAVDISEPSKLRLLGALKLPGYSAYLHPFGDGLLMGFGYSGNEDGDILGLKLSMFDVSDPASLNERFYADVASNNGYSDALNDHKAIYVNVEKGLVGIPLVGFGDQGAEWRYALYFFDENEGFKLKVSAQVITQDAHDGFYRYGYGSFLRGLHIDGVFYVVSGEGVTAISLADYSELYRAKL